MAGDRAHQQPHAGAAIAAVDRLPGRAPGRAAHDPGAVLLPLGIGAERADRGGGVEHVLAFEQAFDPRLARGHRAENQRPVRDRFVARHGDMAAEAAARRSDQPVGRIEMGVPVHAACDVRLAACFLRMIRATSSATSSACA